MNMHNFELKFQNDVLYLNIDDFLENPQEAIQKIKMVKHNIENNSNQSCRYKWNDELLLKFALAVTEYGVRNVKPKHIQKIFESDGLQNYQIGSHLQKYKLKLAAEYNLQSFDQLENWMVAQQFQPYESIQKAMCKWKHTDNSTTKQNSSLTTCDQSTKNHTLKSHDLSSSYDEIVNTIEKQWLDMDEYEF